MSIKITCDVCGREIHGFEDGGHFDHFEVCKECFNKLEKHRDKWDDEKMRLFKNFIAENLKKPAVQKSAPHTHVCKCKGGKPAAVATVKGTPKEHVHKLVTTPELAKAIGAKVHTVQCFALRKGLGVIDAKKRVRVFNEADVKVVASHFKGTAK